MSEIVSISDDLRPVRERLVYVDDAISDLRQRTNSEDRHIGALMVAQAGLHRRIDRVVERLERLETRLDSLDQH